MGGSIIPKGKDTWKIIVSMGTGPDGKRRRHIETIHGRKSAAQARIRELLTLKDKGIITPRTKLTLAEHLTNWLGGYVRSSCSPRTIDSYESIAERHIIPALGHYQLRRLNYQTINEYYARAKGALSPRTVAKHHRLLSQALKYAVIKEILARNPCDLADAPKWQPKPMRTLTEWEVSIFLEAAKDSFYYPVYYTALSTGLRQAELCGLRWRDLDLDLLSISVNQVLYKRRGVCETKPPKTQNSRRQIRLTPKLALYLKDYRAEKETLYWRLAGKPLPLDSFVFGFLNKPCDPSILSHDFAIIARKAGLEGVRFHDLRHTFASLMLSRGAPAKVISEALGHASVAFTLQTYAHVLSGMQEKAMELLNGILPDGVSKQTDTFLTPTR
jgi:integrase